MAPIVVDGRGIFYRVFYNVRTQTYVYCIPPGQDAKAKTH